MKEIPLTKGKVALVDDEDYPLVSPFKWIAAEDKKNGTFYAHSSERDTDGKRRTVKMHRLLMGLKIGDRDRVDHKDRDGLNNQKSNLRLASVAQNGQNRRKNLNNTSGYKGVHWRKQRRKWQARLSYNGNVIFLGHYSAPEEAYAAYCRGAKKYFGEFARLE